MQYSCDENNNAGGQDNFVGANQTSDAIHNNSADYSDGLSSMLSSSGTSEPSPLQKHTYIDPLETNIHPAYEKISTYLDNNSDMVSHMENHMVLHSTKVEATEMSHFEVASSVSKVGGECVVNKKWNKYLISITYYYYSTKLILLSLYFPFQIRFIRTECSKLMVKLQSKWSKMQVNVFSMVKIIQTVANVC